MKRIHRLLLSGCAGLLLSLPWFGLPGWILFFAFVPLLYLEHFFYKYKEGFPTVSLWGHVFFAALIWNILASWWMTKVSLVGVGSAMIFNAFLMSTVWWAAHSIRRDLSSPLGYISLVVFWISLEYLQFSWDIEWPCLQLGSVLASNLKIIQWYEYTGTFGGTLWILLLNIFLFKLLQSFLDKTKQLKVKLTYVTVSGLFILVPIVWSLILYTGYTEEKNPIHISIIQPNVDPYTEKFDMESEEQKLDDFLRLATHVTTDSTDLIVGPETVFEHQYLWNEDGFQSNHFLNELQHFLNNFKKAELVFGVSSFKVYENEDEITPSAQNKDGVIYDRFNTALLLDRAGETQIYHKSKLVAGVEKVPFQKYFSVLKNNYIDLGGTSGTLGRQTEASNLEMQNGVVIAPVICFESVFGAYVSDYVKKGAELIVVMTNDGWWKNSRGYKQHLLFSQLRAIETRRSIARAANTGTSCFINQRGEVLQATNWWEAAAISGCVNKNDEITYYVEHGDFIPRAAIFVSIMIVLLVFVRRFR
ncbi:apolipoprotein N-acyltransferase [Draconibacterium sp. IB214405]|uniref:apolipoprotein N-acyltransferase n=1 Tax=Draconibacterium sp. IB214405 TaxID=3097352 RepID=UPI002A146699|nr:apolipoprotein N-acyltransferase [Draconibacterium sp. IB214405]MDX8341009.1 apolipoprotein N-acyltransferase [Draconibacterium sp. IB214405]